jgi:hypothetical protein
MAKLSLSQMMTKRSMTFCSSRMLPGQPWPWRISIVRSSMFSMVFPTFLA